MSLTSAAERELLDALASVKRAVFRQYKRKSARLTVTAATLRRAGARGDALWELMSQLGDALGRRIEREHLTFGVHTSMQTRLRKINNAAVSWQVAFQNILMGKSITVGEAVEIQQLLAWTAMESHHVVEARMWSRFPELQAAYASKDEMIGIALFSGEHRGATYQFLGKDTDATRALLKQNPPSPVNLTRDLQARFDAAYLATNPTFREFILELASFYKASLPAEMYRRGANDGVLPALQKVAADTGLNIPASAWP